MNLNGAGLPRLNFFHSNKLDKQYSTKLGVRSLSIVSMKL